MIDLVSRPVPVDLVLTSIRHGVQFALLVLISLLADAIVDAVRLPLPSSVVGMLVLVGLLHRGVLRLDHVDVVAAFLVRHLAFFFIPIAVGLMAYRELLATTGGTILCIVGASAVAGMLAAGWVMQALKRRQP